MKRTPLKRRRPMRRSAFLREHKQAPEILAFRVAVLARAKGRCERCGVKARLDAHHIVPRSRAPGWKNLHQPFNGAALCRPCHQSVHDRRDDWRRWLKSAPPRGEAK